MMVAKTIADALAAVKEAGAIADPINELDPYAIPEGRTCPICRGGRTTGHDPDQPCALAIWKLMARAHSEVRKEREAAARRKAGPDGKTPEPRNRKAPAPAAATVDEGDTRPEIIVARSDTHARTAGVLERLRADNAPPVAFETDGALSHVVPGRDGAQVRRLAYRDNTLWVYLNGRYRWRQKTKDGTERLDGAPTDVCKTLGGMAPGSLGLPELRSVIRAPGFAPDATLLRPGYCAAARAWVDLGSLVVPPVSLNPSQEERAAALELLLDELLVDFAFDSQASRANTLALILTPFVRMLLPEVEGVAPLFLVTAARPGEGKGYVTKIASVIATGQPEPRPLRLDLEHDSETDKRILALLLESPAMIRLDNLPELRLIDSPSLADALTADTIGGRVLNQSRTAAAWNRATWCATGNNPRLAPDLVRRSVYIRLEGDAERPDERTGPRPGQRWKHDPIIGWTVANRPTLVAACLTSVQAWIAEGRPSGAVTFGSFEPWARTIGGILGFAGCTGFLANRKELAEAADVDSDVWCSLFDAWWERHESKDLRVSDVLDLLREYDAAERLHVRLDGAEFILGKGDERAMRRHVAAVLAARIGRVYSGRKLVKGARDNRAKAHTYRLDNVAGVVPIRQESAA